MEPEKTEQKEIQEAFSDREETSLPIYFAQAKNWVIVATILGILIALGIWSFAGRITTEVVGRSVSLSPSGVSLLRANGPGTVTDLFVQKEESVESGAPLAKIYNPSINALLTSIEDNKIKLEKLEIELLLLCQMLENDRKLAEEGLIAKVIFDQSKINVMDKQIAIEEAKNALDALYSSLEEASAVEHEEFHKIKEGFQNQLYPDLQKIEAKLSTVHATKNGKILERLVKVGDIVDRKTSLFWMENSSPAIESEVFFSAVDADVTGRVRKGARVLIEPYIVNPQEYGAIIGEVVELQSYPSSKDQLLDTIGNQQIVDYLAGVMPSPVMTLVVKPKINPKNKSGLMWTSPKGPPFKIPTGTAAKIRVVIDEQPPISYLIPLWRIEPR